jgi:AmiR/NasT family two-component response regulator
MDPQTTGVEKTPSVVVADGFLFDRSRQKVVTLRVTVVEGRIVPVEGLLGSLSAAFSVEVVGADASADAVAPRVRTTDVVVLGWEDDRVVRDRVLAAARSAEFPPEVVAVTTDDSGPAVLERGATGVVTPPVTPETVRREVGRATTQREYREQVREAVSGDADPADVTDRLDELESEVDDYADLFYRLL